VHAFPSLHVAGQFPSHVSGLSTMLLPHTAGQSLSLFRLHPAAQQPSLFVHIEIVGNVH
jgi:hypothetical protein